jgi:hypothetical protein
VEIGAGWCYDLGYGLQTWARWCLDLQDPANTSVPPVVKMVAKGWGRSVLGRFASRRSQQILVRPATSQGWSLEHGRHEPSGSPMDIVTVGGEERWLLQDQESRDSLPALFAWVESATRASLTRIILSRPEGSVLQCDTDGWLEREAWRTRSDDMPEVPWPHKVHRKGRYDSIRIIGPVHLELGADRRLAGIGRTSTSSEPDHFVWWDWPGLRWQLQHGEAGTYQRTKRTAVLHDNIVKRWVYADGSTRPARSVVLSDGSNRLELDTETAWAHLHGDLYENQHPRLAELLDA